MPSVKKYQSETGYYIRSNIDDRFVTLQLSPEAEGLLSDLGFQDGESISWQFLQPLCDSGHAYTNKSGTEVTTDTIDVENSVTPGRLNREDQQRLEEFIAAHTPENIKSGNTGNSGEQRGSSPSDVDIDEETRSFIQKWSPSDEEYEATLNRIGRADDTAGILKSVKHHGTEHPMTPRRFRVSSRGIPTYSFETGDVAWTVHDYRTIEIIGTDAELFFDIQPGTAEVQSVTIETETIEWHTKGERFTSEQIDDFVRVAPEILYYVRQLAGGQNVSSKEIIDSATAAVPSEDTSRIDELTAIQSVDPEEYDRLIGTVLTFGKKGYGRVRAHTGHTFKFVRDCVESDDIEPGDVVTFDVKNDKGKVYAEKIRREDIGLSSSEIIVRWPDWNDRSLAWIREHWAEDDGQSRTRGDTIVLPHGENNHDHECLSVTVDLLSFYLATNKEETAKIVDEAVRTLLKGSIDGYIPAPESPVATKDIEISLPKNIVSMIDSVINTSPEYESRGQFFNTALQQHFEQDDEVDMTVRVPRGYHDVVEQLADDRSMSTTEFMQTALENIIETELMRKG